MSIMLDKTYDPATLEAAWYERWEKSGLFAPQGDGPAFCIMLPPPNVTGSLHMGHAFEASIMDCLVRYHRMQGDNTHWQVGTDHAGIATQMVVERKLAQEGKKRLDMGRDAFQEAVWEWKKISGGTIAQQFKRMGISADWSRERFTLDEGLSQAVREVFIRLFDEGLIYRGQRLVNWDCVLKTAVSDLEVETREEAGSLWHIRYPLNETDYIVVATTRPETLLGDQAVAVHPDDPRYQAWIGKTVLLPLTGRHIPVIADHYVEPEFGSGCVKITPAHDFNDYAVGQRHALTPLNILNPDGTLNDNVPEQYRGLDRFEARKRIVEDLTTAGFIDKIEPYTTKRPYGDRSQSVLEPFLTYQWFVKTQPLAEPAIQAVESGAIQFSPPHWANTYFAWMREIQDWCISRQLWWGHRIPAWYDHEGNIYVAENEAAVRKKYSLPENLALRQEEDVLDTWFSAGLWPFSTLGWPEETPDFKTFYPTNVLISGFDIIFFWVSRMIMMGLKLTGQVPFRHVYIHGLICDSQGQKMSKSRGNVLDPIDLIQGIDLESLVQKRTYGLMQPQKAKAIEKDTRRDYPEGIPACGTDALRLSFCALPSTQRHIQFDLQRLLNYRNFCNKLWNSARYVLMNVTAVPALQECKFSIADRFITSRLQKTIVRVREHLDQFRFDLAVQALYEFTWNDFCDWYLELSKPQLQSEEIALKFGAQYTLVTSLEILLRLLHPFIPFMTEAIAEQVASILPPLTPMLINRPYPKSDDIASDAEAEQEIELLQSVIIALRNIRSETQISPKKSITLWVETDNESLRTILNKHIAWLQRLAHIEKLVFTEPATELPASASAAVGDLKLHVPLAGLIDIDAERIRIDKQLKKLQQEHDKLSSSLANPAYTERAPAHLVARDQARLNELDEQIKLLSLQKIRL